MPAVRTKGKPIPADELRSLGDLIRQRYALDVEIWTLRSVRARDRPLVMEKMRRADAALGKIRRIVVSFDNPKYFESPTDYKKLQEIKERIMEEGKRNWTQHPPWEDRSDS